MSQLYDKLAPRELSGATPVLVKIDSEELRNLEADFGGTIYLTDNGEDIEYKGHIYKACSLQYRMPSIDSQGDGSGNMTISAIDQRIIKVMRTLKKSPIFSIIAAYHEGEPGGEPTILQLDRQQMKMTSITWDVNSLKANLSPRTLVGFNFPAHICTVINTPGLS